MIQLRIRTEYSFGETYAPIPRIVERLKAIGCKAAGIVDNGSTWGHVKWHNSLTAAGITPLLGVQLAVGDDQRSMWFLARNAEGLRELYNASSKAHRQSIATKIGTIPRLFFDDVLGMSENIAKFAGDHLDADFLTASGAYIDVNPSSRILALTKRDLAKRTKLRLVTTSDNNYSFPEDKATFELVGRVRPTPQHILDVLEECDDMSEFLDCKYELAKSPMVRMKGKLEALCRKGIKARKMKWCAEYEERLKHELGLIKLKDYESYFLIVADMVKYAKQHMLVGPSRGSAAGSLVCYLTGITEIDPLPAGLLFERFIDITRKDLPDIDLDFPDAKRHMVFDYMTKKYGNVSHIGTITTFQPRSALVQVCKKMRIPIGATQAVKAAMIERSSADARANSCLLDTLNGTEPGQQLVSSYPQVLRAAELEGHASHTGVHAAGLLVSNEPIEDYATVTKEGIAQVEKGAAEQLGLLKIDVLGLRTLGILEDSGVDVDWYGLTFDDEKTYDVFNSGRLCGIFQFEGNAMRSIASQMTCETIDDIDAVTALARPGPFAGGVTKDYLERRKGKQYASLHHLVEKYMSKTYGLPIYQEQTLAILREIGKFDWKSLADARKAISKSLGKEFFERMWPTFKKGAEENGIDESSARKVWELINGMGSWQMNKAHTYSYAVLSYWTAYLKAHYPLEFAASNLRHAKDEDAALRLLREMVSEGLVYEPFDPYLSEASWSVKDGKLVGGYDNLVGFGKAKSEQYIEARSKGKLTELMVSKALEAKNPFKDLFPMYTMYSHMYDDPMNNGIVGKLYKLNELNGEQNCSCVFLGKVINKQTREINEDALIKKRNGKIESGPKNFIDITVQDDTETLMARVDRFRYQRIGVGLLENVAIGDHILVRAKFIKNIRFGFIEKWRVLNESDRKGGIQADEGINGNAQ